MFKIIFTFFITLFSLSAFADNDVTVINEREISIDFTKYNIPAGTYKKPAMKAFIARNWEILKVGTSSVTAELPQKEDISQVVIDFSKAPVVSMKYIEKEKDINLSYLNYLKRDMLDKLLTCN